ncbi:MAG: hypothetical protein LUE27_08465 [Clostridia bacterium]|nr:hypothetical protein [Clostridia bacterium]
MCTDKQYTIIAGVNGAGKTTLYYASNARWEESRFGVRLNADDTVRVMGLDWRDDASQIKAGREVLRRLNVCFAEGGSCNQETTLCGAAVMNCIRRTKSLGYIVNVLYVGVDSPDIAISRVASRTAMAGTECLRIR